jgi:Zn-dependent peptidase ImmA (M78 family)
MKAKVEISSFDIVVESLGMIWDPGAEALKLRQDFDIQSVDDIPLAAERAGCEIFYVDLPLKVSGFAQVIEGKPHIVVNRAKPSTHKKFTIAHELGHHLLHCNSTHGGDKAGLLTESTAEFQANMFATALATAVTSQEEREKLLAHNPEMQSTLAICIFGSILAILTAFVIWFCSYLFRTQGSALIETT